ncbi:GNAT family N-acetyltransferase [Escherichia ruysiae]|uniref:GNAT family N-acetyltransferase n=1 Tax=Escherichia TaxID=561 RepID=UPI000CF797AB|nr:MULTISPECIES: GNAT family N-acetyltransferase [Escherichia]MBS5153522.1 GNAT family N-acetyltransferase [Escherichia coli]MBY7309583.1 GNAT family N-acetyltransferase [Escherichia ruysiae]
MDEIVVSKSPNNCDVNELEIFKKLVIEGAEVDPVGLSRRILDAEHLFFIYAQKECVGIGAIKRPGAEYKLGSFEKAGVSEQEKYEYELGWVYVNEKMRGRNLGGILMKSICNHMSENLSGKGCFGTVRQDNKSMQYLFAKYHFSKPGHSYKSRRGDYFLDLYVKK